MVVSLAGVGRMWWLPDLVCHLLSGSLCVCVEGGAATWYPGLKTSFQVPLAVGETSHADIRCKVFCRKVPLQTTPLPLLF